MELYDSRTKLSYEFEGSIGCFTEMNLREETALKEIYVFCQKDAQGDVRVHIIELGEKIHIHKGVILPMDTKTDYPLMIHDCIAQ